MGDVCCLQVNWTATYRLDSTLVTPYERFTYFANYSGHLPERAPRDVKAGKTRHVAWFVSNCNAGNGRKAYVDELQQYIGRRLITANKGGSVAEWLACWTQAQGLGSKRSRDAVKLGQTVRTHRASVHQAAKLVAALLRVARVTAGLAESNGSLPPGL